MATAAVQHASDPSTLISPQQSSLPVVQSHDVTTTLHYYKDPGDGSPPKPSIVGKPETYDRPSEPRTVTINDIRGKESNYTLDTTGFQAVKRPATEKEFLDDEQIKASYYPEVEQLLKDVTGGTEVFIFDHTIRRAPLDNRTGPSPTPASPVSLRGPVFRVHIDQSYTAGKSRVTHHLPNEAPRLLAGRYGIYNVWRPIRPVAKDPLAIADANSVPDSDLLPVKLIYPNREGETFTVRPNPAHRWHYLSGQTPDEALVIKCFDSKEDGRARRSPHSAFEDPSTVDREPRESIEVRALVFHPDDKE